MKTLENRCRDRLNWYRRGSDSGSLGVVKGYEARNEERPEGEEKGFETMKNQVNALLDMRVL